MNNFGEKVSFIWSVADLLRGPYKPPQYGRVILPLTVLHRRDCVLAPTKAKVLAKVDRRDQWACDLPDGQNYLFNLSSG